MLFVLRKCLLVPFSFQIRKCLDADFQLMRIWKQEENINPGLHDFDAFKMIKKFSFWTGTLQGLPIAFFGSGQYDDNFAHLASFFVKKQHRKEGYGMQLWNHVLSNLNAKNIGLNAVLRQQTNYSGWGFITSDKTTRYFMKGTNQINESRYLVDCRQINLELLSNYDRKKFPSIRKQFLHKWINLPGTRAVAFIQKNIIEGYGVLRLSADGYKIGPLFAERFEIAQQILQKLRSGISSQSKIFIDIPQSNQNGQKLSQEFKMTEVLSHVRMFTKKQPDCFKNKAIYGITSLQFG